MENSKRESEPHLTSEERRFRSEERRFRLEEKRLDLDSSFAKKWLPTLATLMAVVIAAMFSYVQQQAPIEETKRAGIEAKAKDEHNWGIKVIEMYFDNHKLFDITRDPETASLNLRVLAAVAPTAVQGVLNAEQSRIPPPTGNDDTNRIKSLAAVAGVQEALAAATPSRPLAKPSDFTVYVQYVADDKDIASKAQSALRELGYRVPGIEKVEKVPSSLQVRYYHPEQKPLAGKLADELGKQLGLSTRPDTAVLLTSSKQLPGGILEVWIPRQAN